MPGAQSYQGPSDEVLLDDIESSSRRIFVQSKLLNEEAIAHLRILHGIEGDLDSTTSAIHKEAIHAELARRQSRGGVCWMYIIIMLEITTLILLIFYGLS
jgi:hypothetical protein